MSLFTALRNPRQRRTMIAALTMLTPNFVGFLVFVAGPVLFSLVMAFTNWNLTEHNKRTGQWPNFVWMDNFVRLMHFHRNPVSPSAPHALLWGILGAALVVVIPVLLFCCYRAYRAEFPQENPPFPAFILFALTCISVLSLGMSVVRGTVLTHPHLGIWWPILKLLFAVGCAYGSWVGLAMLQSSDRRRLARFGLLFLLLCVDIRVLAAGAPRILSLWQPENPLFFQFLWNTVFLMFGMPLGVAGSLIGAIILSHTIRVGTLRVRLTVAGGLLICGLLVSIALRSAAPETPELAGLLTLIALVAAGGVLGGVVVFRTLFYLPSISMGVATFILWQKMFDPEKGPINSALGWLFNTAIFQHVEALLRWWIPTLGPHWHLAAPDWLLSPEWAKPALMIMGLWAALGSSNMLLYLAGLSNIPTQLYEAAEIDGASGWRKFWSVTWPQLAPTTFFIIVMGTIGGLQGGFEQARVMTNGGPARSTTTLSFFLYTEAFENFDMGYASAIAWTLFVVIFALTMINWRFGSEIVSEYQ